VPNPSTALDGPPDLDNTTRSLTTITTTITTRTPTRPRLPSTPRVPTNSPSTAPNNLNTAPTRDTTASKTGLNFSLRSRRTAVMVARVALLLQRVRHRARAVMDSSDRCCYARVSAEDRSRSGLILDEMDNNGFGVMEISPVGVVSNTRTGECPDPKFTIPFSFQSFLYTSLYKTTIVDNSLTPKSIGEFIQALFRGYVFALEHSEHRFPHNCSRQVTFNLPVVSDPICSHPTNLYAAQHIVRFLPGS